MRSAGEPADLAVLIGDDHLLSSRGSRLMMLESMSASRTAVCWSAHERTGRVATLSKALT